MPGKSSLSSLVVDLEVNSAKLRTGLDQANAQIRKLSAQMAESNKTMGDGFAGLTSKVGSFGGALKSVGGMVAGMFAFGKLASVVQNATAAFVEQERATFLLSSALKETGQDAAALVPVFSAQADAFEKSTNFSSEAVSQVQMLLVRYGAAPKQIKGATQALLDYSAASGQDAAAATQTLLQAVDGGKEAIKSLGIHFDKTSDKSKDLQSAVDALEKKWGGSAAAAAQGFGGQMHQLEVQEGDLSKAFGEFIAQMNEKTGALAKLAYGVADLRMILFGDEHVDARKKAMDEVIAAQEKELDLTKKRIEAERMLHVLEKEAPGTVLRDQNGGMLDLAAARKHLATLTLQRNEAMNARMAAQAKVSGLDHTERGDVPAGTGGGGSHRREKTDEEKAKEEREKEKQKAFAERVTSSLDSVFEHLEEAAKRLQDEFSKIDNELAAQMRKLDAEVTGRKAEFAGIGMSDRQRFAARTAGFGNFRAAEEAYKAAAEAQERKLAEAKKYEAQKNYEAAAAAQAAADALGKTAARAKDAADAFFEQKQAAEQARGSIGSGLAGSFGSLSSVVSAGVEGSAAGPEGALAGVFTQLLTQSKGFADLLQMITNVVQLVSDGVGALIEPFTKLVAGLVPLGQAIGMVLEPFSMIYEALFGQFEPILVVVGELLKSLAPLMKIVATGITLVIDVLMLNFTPVLEILFEAIRSAAYGITLAMSKLAPVWNGFIEAIQAFLRKIADFQFKIGDYVIQPFAELGNWASNLDKGKMSVDDLTATLVELEGLTMKEAHAKAENIIATNKQTDAVEKATASITNVPKFWKLASAEFSSMSAPGTNFTTPFTSGKTKTSMYGADRQPPGITINVMGESDPMKTAQKIKEVLRRENFQRNGSLVAASPRFAGG